MTAVNNRAPASVSGPSPRRSGTAASGPVPTSSDDALASVEGAEPVGIPSLGGLVKGVARAFAQPGPVTWEAAQLVVNLARVLKGTEQFTPAPKDKRFADPAWNDNPLYRRWGQAYIAVAEAMDRLVTGMEDGDVDWHDLERARFAVNVLTSAIAPTNLLLGNPAALKRAFETGGRSVLRGVGNFLSDVRANGGMPSQTDRTAFSVGTDLALTPGYVVHRDPVAELIQYSPSTSSVRTRPLLVVPPPIGRFYFLDLRPGRSFVEYAVSQGLQVFLISWRNPGPEQADWDLDTYAGRVVTALDTVKEITGSADVNTLGFCAGGILQAAVLNHLADVGDPGVHSASFAVTLLDFDDRAPIGAFSSPRMLEMASSDSRRKGVISARSLSNVFSWMRPDDLVFNYVINQWLMGNNPPVFDILAWNADGTNLPAKLHAQFLDLFRNNSMCKAGALEVLGSAVDLSRITVPTFVTGAHNDHLTPWTGCYRTTQELSGPSTFVLSSAGHIASLVNPPGNPKASYLVDGELGADPHAWLATAEPRTGTWWEPWSQWLLGRSGSEKPAPAACGSVVHAPLETAPGSYVVDRVSA